MSLIKDQYDIKEKNTAMFVACLKNSSIYENDGKISLVKDETLNELINRLVSEKKFIEANELIKTAKNISNKDKIEAEINSKSFRISFETYSKLFLISTKKDEALGESLKQIIIPELQSTIDKLGKISDIETEKLNLLSTSLNDWSKKVSSKRDLSSYIDLSEHIYEMDENMLKYFQKILYHACFKSELDTQIADMFIESHCENYSSFAKFLAGNLIQRDNNLICSLRNEFSYGADPEDPITGEKGEDVTNGIFYNNSIKMFGKQKTDIFFNKVYDILCDVDETFLGDYEIDFNNGKTFINGIDSHDETLMKNMVYNKLANEYPTYEYNEGSVKISHDISLLPNDFDEENYSKRLQEAVENNDYEKASEISEILEIHQLLTNLSIQICNVLNALVKETRVVTITIPNALLSLFDLTRGEKSAKNFISEVVDEYWANLKEKE